MDDVTHALAAARAARCRLDDARAMLAHAAEVRWVSAAASAYQELVVARLAEVDRLAHHVDDLVVALRRHAWAVELVRAGAGAGPSGSMFEGAVRAGTPWVAR